MSTACERLMVAATCVVFCFAGCGDDSGSDGTAATGTGGTTDSGAGTTGADTTGGTDTTGTGGTTGTDTTGGATTGTDTGGDVCTPGEKFCNGNTLFTCKADGSELDTVTCDNGCEDGQCKTGCVPNESVCKEDGKTLVTCSASGEATETTCDTKCEDGACIEGICEPDAVICEAGGKKLVKCAPDGLSAQTFDVCPYGCTEGESDCNDAACEENETQCAEDDPLYVEVCNDEQTAWVKADSPCKEECKDGACIVSACDEGESQCAPVGIEICNADKTGFEILELCKSGCLETESGPQCAQCKDGLVQCNGNLVEECKDPLTGFVVIETCSELQACGGGECLDVVVLDEGSKNANIELLFTAFLDCYKAAVEGKCRAIDTTAIDYAITADDVKDWWCNDEEALTASYGEDGEAADNLAGQCGTFEFPNETDFDFEGDIEPGKGGEMCLGYSTEDGLINLNNKEVIVKPCDQW